MFFAICLKKFFAVITRSSGIPASPFTLEVKDAAQYFRLQHIVPDEESVISSQSDLRKETFLVTRLGNKEPHVRASFQHVQKQEVREQAYPLVYMQLCFKTLMYYHLEKYCSTH